EEPTPTPRSIYHTLWEAISNGATTPTQIGGVAGLDAANVTYYLNLMRSAGFIQHDHDLLLQRRPVITLADPIVRFHQLVIRPNLEDFQLRLAGEVLPKMTATISSLILGPQFEDLARKWVKRYASELGVEKSGSVGTTVVACREHRGHQVDVIALDQSSKPRDKGGRIALIGEAKATNRPRSREDIERLSHIRDLLNREGWDAASARLALFSRTGFRTDLKMGADALLIDLEMMYGRPPVGG
ncbi:MAG: AAA family ATPase, partial [Candidatus Dormibacteraceae bacterium]